MMAKSNFTSARIYPAFLALLVAFGLTACEGARTRPQEDQIGPVKNESGPVFRDEYKKEGLLGEDGLFFGGKKRKDDEGTGGAGLGVNSFLWRASLDTISFMPVASADPFGGVIITDWHAQPDVPGERFKLNVYIMGRALRADGVRVAVFRQVDRGGGLWSDAQVPEEAATRIEDAILVKARQLRLESIGR